MKKAIQDHIDFLESRLIPDLEESGREFTAQDFQTCVGHIKYLDYQVEKLKAQLKALKAKPEKKAKTKGKAK